MNERLPYETNFHQQLNDILLPDENMAWEDMKRRLQKEDDDTTIVAWWRRGCMLWGILIGALFIVGLYWYYSSKKVKENSHQSNKKTDISSSKEKDTVSKYIMDTLNSKKEDSDLLISHKTKNVHNDFLSVEEKMPPRKNQEKQAQEPADKKNSKKIIIRSKNKTKTTVHKSQSEIDEFPDSIFKNETDTLIGTTLNKDDSLLLKVDSTFAAGKNAEIAKELIKDSLIKKLASEKLSKKDSSRQNKISFSAGFALHQQVPVNGQTLTPYNSLGRKGTLRDYIPSVYLRLNKNNKWFLQPEFRYGAPQNNKAILFDQRIDSVPFSSKIRTTSNNVKKTYYHQSPLTFNYFITHNWSLGVGIVWNKFYCAVTEQNAVQHDFISGADSIITQGVINRQTKADSNFSKSFFQGLIETQFKWKRFSFGASYAQGLQPFIKFRLPGEAEKKERNSSLQFFIRYEIWNSKNKQLSH